MMAFFDSLVQREIEGWSAEETDSQSAGETTAMAARVTGVTTRMQAAINTANRRRRNSRRLVHLIYPQSTSENPVTTRINTANSRRLPHLT